ncbi:ATP-binding protein [Aeromicrobium sp. SORGH_AS_0981]|uniref:AAA family ATPase n=1 Tax=Aeromicrobium sp. SORGH_AS_0981 TaxID=3041802 RepID=UPI00286B3ED6|nr:ATP-binding protein [Aeromicrobium sp. SORGH_AS_0981]
MSLIAQSAYKSLPPAAVSGISLPIFTVLTGPNGSGKSNLLEALQAGTFYFDELGPLPSDQIRLFALGQLLAAAEGPTQAASFREPWANLYNAMQSWLQEAPRPHGMDAGPDYLEQWIIEQAVSSKLTTLSAITRMKTEAKKDLHTFHIDDFQKHAPLLAGVKDPFAASIAEVFLSYRQRKTQNDMAQWRLEKKGQGEALTDDEFSARFGPSPWTLLDETLRLVGLNYQFIPPPEFSENANYEVLLNRPDNVQIRPGELSSGERVLLAVAMSLFTGSRLSEAIELPRVLLLDEADASLHPSMVKSLLTVIEEVFVAQYGVRVILSTHSPSTVALAPEDSLFVMNPSGVRLRKASTDEALNMLTVGISTLSVRLENRRQVLVESEYDQAVYQELFSIVKQRLHAERSAEFISVGKESSGGGCENVKRLVISLSTAGSGTVRGIVDRDNRSDAPTNVHFTQERHSLENFVLDPLLLGTLLIRENIVAAADMDLPEGLRHFELAAHHAPQIVNHIAGRLEFSSSGTEIEYAGGFSVQVPTDFLETRGHDLETLILNTFPQLRRFRSDLKIETVRRAAADRPDFVPRALIDLFETVLA